MDNGSRTGASAGSTPAEPGARWRDVRGISPPERTVIIVRLARLLLEAAAVPMRERDDDRH